MYVRCTVQRYNNNNNNNILLDVRVRTTRYSLLQTFLPVPTPSLPWQLFIPSLPCYLASATPDSETT